MEQLIGAAAGNGAPAPVKDINERAFMAEVIEASRTTPVIVDFWAPWCGPCKTLGPMLERAVAAAKGKVKMVKVNIDQNQALATQMRIQSIPAVYAFKDGRPVDGFVGALPESQIKAFVQRLQADGAGGGEEEEAIAEALEQAKELLAQGNAGAAANLYDQILKVAPDNPVAIAGHLRCLIAQGDSAGALAALTKLPPELAKEPEIAAIRATIELAETGAKAGASAGLKAKVDASPADHQARFDLAMALFAEGGREAAVDELLELFRRDRKWNDDAARKQLVKFFEAFGPTDPLTVSARRRLSALMFQ
ncbi:MAG: thioredoxin [Proteobacteria bacterium]|nr:thioredoxin [Pseudomonadota bacterium]MBI3497383.1 thioredoxin [Pseudomonadota bacterium]